MYRLRDWREMVELANLLNQEDKGDVETTDHLLKVLAGKKTFELSNIELSRVAVRRLNHLFSNYKLEINTVVLRAVKMEDENAVFAALAVLGRQQSFSLDLRDTIFNNKTGVDKLRDLVKESYLTSLNISGVRLYRREDMVNILEALPGSGLQHLILANCVLDPDLLNILAEALDPRQGGSTSLRTLDISGEQYGLDYCDPQEEGPLQNLFNALKANTSLRCLKLHRDLASQGEPGRPALGYRRHR